MRTGIVLIIFILCTEHILACRYNVRDVGFVDIVSSSYHLSITLDPDTPDETFRLLESTVRSVLSDTNIRAEILRREDTSAPESPARPSADLSAADGRSISVDLQDSEGKITAESIWESILPLRTSDFRRSVLEATIDNYALILIIQGSDTSTHSVVQQAAEGALADILSRWKDLPKKVEGAPRILTLSPGDREREKYLLWALGLDPRAPGTHAAVVYGKGRLMGPLLDTTMITTDSLSQALWMVGQSCECDLDRRWMSGSHLPVHWPTGLRARAARKLGFDPESPLVKSEISRLLARGPNSTSEASGKPGLPSRIGYQEIPVDEGLDTSVMIQEEGLLGDEELDALISSLETSAPGDQPEERDEVETEAGKVTSGSSADGLLSRNLLRAVAIIGTVVLLGVLLILYFRKDHGG